MVFLITMETLSMMSMCLRIVYSVVFIVVFCCMGSVPEVLIEESSAIESMHAPTGGAVELPCDVTPALLDDRIGLVIWYKQGHETPIYSFDIREGVTSHWSDPSTLGARATFREDTSPAVLVLTKLRPEDSGQYRCRVDFIKSPTKNTRLNLTILIPPERLIVLNQDGDELQNGVLGPYDEGTAVNLTCLAIGGYPAARVSWWKSHALIANSGAKATVAFTLQRADYGTEIICQAVTDPSIPPVSRTISIDVNLPLLWLRLQGGKRPLVAGQVTELTCEAVGARPKPSITWWRGGTRLKDAKETVSTDGNVTTSIMTFVPSLDDAGRVMSCRAAHATLPYAAHEDGWKMEIQHIPVVTLELGANLDASKVLEGSDVYLDCRVKANPWHTHVYFSHNGVTVKPGSGVLLANQSLVLQKVSRKAAGDYVCVARNSLGDGSSKTLKLDVKYLPTCKTSQITILRAAKGEVIDIDCDVDANPKESMSYQWWFNSSSHGKLELPNAMLNTLQINKLRHYLYMVNASTDYGWVQCSASNSVGQQNNPCQFQIQPAEKPSPVKNCEVTNLTYESLAVRCNPGHDGGIRQAFLLQIVETTTGALLHNITSDAPEFHVEGLRAGNSLSVSVIAFNKKGASEPIYLTPALLKLSQKHTAQVPMKVELTTVLTIVATSAAAVIAIAAIATAVFFCIRCHKPTEKTEKDKKQNETSSLPLTGNKDAESVESLDKNPDIIPLDGKTSDSCSNKSSATDYSSTRPLISTSSMDKYDIPSNHDRCYDYNIKCNQYIQIRPMEYRLRPKYQPMPNLRPNIQSIGPIGSFGLVGPNESRRELDKVYEDWLKYKNTLPLNTSALLPPEQMMPSEIYPPPSLYSNPQPLSQMPGVEQRYCLEPRSSMDSRTRSSSPPVRFQDNGVYFHKSIAEETISSPNCKR